jgi:hypothetical protein
VRMAALLGAQAAPAQAAIRAAIAAAVAALPRDPAHPEAFSVPTAAILVSAPTTPIRDPD